MFSSKNSTQLTGTRTTVDTFHTVLRMPAPSGIPCDASLRNSLILITFFEICIQQKAIINDPKYKQTNKEKQELCETMCVIDQ